MAAFDARAFLEALYVEPVAVVGLVDSADGITRPEDLPDDWLELWHERSAIREFDGGQAREHAEAEALAEVLARMRAAENKG